ncbi:MAG TPA: enoyl-CoA hydratase-related protein [Nitriliruptorales bacterium]
MSDAVRTDLDAGTLTITLARPENRNALSPSLVNGLGDALAGAEDRHDVRVIVLTNDGPAFCAGADLKGGDDQEPRYTLPELIQSMQSHPKPVVGRIAGHCTGGGVGLAAACDLSIAADDVVFGFTEVRLGVAPAMISVVVLPKLRRGEAMELFLSGEKVGAARAADAGIVNRAVPRHELDAAVEELTGKIVRGGPEALAVTKRLVYDVPRMHPDGAWPWTERLSAERFASDEARAGIAAFREKTDAPWVP